LEGKERPSVEGVYQDLVRKISPDYKVEGNRLIAGRNTVTFEPSSFGFDIYLDTLFLGNTSDNYFLVYLTELFEKRDEDSLKRLRSLSEDGRTLLATELQGTISHSDHGFKVGKREVLFSARYFVCSCPDWKYRRRLGGCKHIAALRLLDV